MANGTIFYIGAYSGDEGLRRKNPRQNIAGTMKMNFVRDCIRRLGCDVCLVCIAPAHGSGFCPQETVTVDGHERHVYLPSLVLRVLGRNIVRGDCTNFFLARWMRRNLTADDTVVVYHSLAYGGTMRRMQKKIGFRLVTQVEELYCLSRADGFAPEDVEKERRLFDTSDGFLFVNDLMPARFGGGRPCAVSYGNYRVFLDAGEKPAPDPAHIGVVFTGLINEDRGAFRLLEAVPLLPRAYTLHILGMGEQHYLDRLQKRIAELNAAAGEERITFYGTRTGAAYTEFLRPFQIGVSLMDSRQEFALGAFPSKIMAYLGHGLRVVSSKNECITQSRVADLLAFCDDDAASIARAIESIDVTQKNETSERLRAMAADFERQLDAVLRAPKCGGAPAEQADGSR